MTRAARFAADAPARWRADRRSLNERRHPLTQTAGRLYPDAARAGGGAEPVQAAGAAVLQLAWRHRARLLR